MALFVTSLFALLVAIPTAAMKRRRKNTGQLIGLTLGLLGPMSYLAMPLPSLVNFSITGADSPSFAQVTGVTIFAVTTGNNLVSFNSATPGALSSTTPITGLQSGERILGIDFDDAGELYALGGAGRLYTINTTTGAATREGTRPFNPALNGTAFGFDYDPAGLSFRVVNDADQNLRLSFDVTEDIVVEADTTLAYATGDANASANPNVVGAAYTYNVTATTLFGIDSNLDTLVRQGSPEGRPISPNAGQLFTVGPLGINTTAEVGFDIAAQSGMAFVSLTPTGAASSSFYTLNLATGAATLVGVIGGSELIRDVAVATPALRLRSVSAASYSGVALASGSIVAAFGPALATATQVATMIPLPTSLAGTTVKVRDSAGTERLAPLFFVSPAQVNYQIPPGTAAGVAIITTTSGNGTISNGVAQIAPVAPGIFTANANGLGVAAAVALRARADGSQVYEAVAQFDTATARFVAAPIDLGPASDQVFLILFGTGIRFRSSLAAVTCQIGGTSSEALYAGEVPGLVGLDQANVRLSRSLIGRGEMDVVLTVDGRTANTVRVNIK